LDKDKDLRTRTNIRTKDKDKDKEKEKTKEKEFDGTVGREGKKCRRKYLCETETKLRGYIVHTV